eukprot:TRINITY_DN5024_c0_g1_i2.p1 TRINITY_DN5024_c0_g1~~TRINITY_DN5024_c0_g1_i2.p1  ORF type:complete len:458 (+),score=97.22 TRINITY_DN5024_c0_g1_i2:372-1745(+)
MPASAGCSAALLLATCADDGATVETALFGRVRVAPLEMLAAVKRSHLRHPVSWLKHFADHYAIAHALAGVPLSVTAERLRSLRSAERRALSPVPAAVEWRCFSLPDVATFSALSDDVRAEAVAKALRKCGVGNSLEAAAEVLCTHGPAWLADYFLAHTVAVVRCFFRDGTLLPQRLPDRTDNGSLVLPPALSGTLGTAPTAALLQCLDLRALRACACVCRQWHRCLADPCSAIWIALCAVQPLPPGACEPAFLYDTSPRSVYEATLAAGGDQLSTATTLYIRRQTADSVASLLSRFRGDSTPVHLGVDVRDKVARILANAVVQQAFVHEGSPCVTFVSLKTLVTPNDKMPTVCTLTVQLLCGTKEDSYGGSYTEELTLKVGQAEVFTLYGSDSALWNARRDDGDSSTAPLFLPYSVAVALVAHLLPLRKAAQWQSYLLHATITSARVATAYSMLQSW